MNVRERLDAAHAKAARRRVQPAWIEPMLATLTKTYFSDPGWVFEPKLDGIRCVAFKKGSSVKLLSRNRLDLTPTVSRRRRRARRPGAELRGRR